jgi:hypothetical protein
MNGDPSEPAGSTPEAIVYVADGIGGFDLCVHGLRRALRREGLAGHEVRAVGWGHGWGRWYRDLTDVPWHAARAEALAADVRAALASHPGVPVYLVGKSGGTGIVARALAGLPAGSVERAVLLSSALSPAYDLTAALGAVRREVVAFSSPLDVFFLGAGTEVFRTIDRVRTPAAGLVGFRMPPGADPAAYAKLRQVRWTPRLIGAAHLGGHLGADNPRFLRRVVVPLLAPDGPVASPSG